MPSYVKWFPERFNAKLLTAFRQSVGDAKNVAMLASPSKTKAGARYTLTGPTSARLSTTGRLGHIFEGGREGGYVIQPGLKTVRGKVGGIRQTTGVRAGSDKKALKFAGRYAAVAIGGPMKAKPYIGPASAVWARTLYQRRARSAIRGGF